MEIFIKIVQLLFSLSLLVILHELGHFLAARAFKIKVEKFYLFFNPWFSIFKFTKGDTTYGIGWLPLGGYVKIAGMIDESMDKEALKQEPQPWEFRSKPAWQRLIVMIGGVLMNLIFAIIIFIFMLFFWGEQYLPNKSVKYGISVNEIGKELGLRDGDKIIKLDNKEPDNFASIPFDILLNKTKEITVERNNEIIEINVDRDVANKMIREKEFQFIAPLYPNLVIGMAENSVAYKSGIELGDIILSINDEYTPYFKEMREALNSLKNQEVEIGLLREKDTVKVSLVVPESGLLGINISQDPFHHFDFKTKDYNLFQSIPGGVKLAFKTSADYLKQLRIIFTPETKAYESLGGFITIGSLFPGNWNWYQFWKMTAFISIILAIMNLLPIPALDGGHVMFLMWEIITGRKPHEKFMEYAQMAGMIFLLLLVLMANGNDIFRLFK